MNFKIAELRSKDLNVRASLGTDSSWSEIFGALNLVEFFIYSHILISIIVQSI